jgi:nitrogen fixation/metabolism regulation signal transduction histidine kinase
MAVNSDNASDPMILPALAVVQLALQSQTESMIGLAEGDDWDAVRLRVATEIRPLEFTTSALVERVDRKVKAEQAEAAANIREARNRIFVLVPATVLLTLLIAGTLGLAITRSITRPLERLVERSKMLARGDFKCQVAVDGADELAHLGRVFNDTVAACSIFMKACRVARTSELVRPHSWLVRSPFSLEYGSELSLKSRYSLPFSNRRNWRD